VNARQTQVPGACRRVMMMVVVTVMTTGPAPFEFGFHGGRYLTPMWRALNRVL